MSAQKSGTSAARPRGAKRFSAFFAMLGLAIVAGVLFTVGATPALALAGITASSTAGAFDTLPSSLTIGNLAEPSTLYMKKNGTWKAFATFFAQNREEVSLKQIAPVVESAAIDTEDPRFYEHHGVDVLSTLRATVGHVFGGSTSGASTITMQYVRNIAIQQSYAITNAKKAAAAYETATETTLTRKLQEMKYAIALEKKYSKAQILDGYLNIALFGGNVYGIEAAAKYYFNTTAADLTPAQSASLIATVNNPQNLRLDYKANWASNKVRRDYVLKNQYKAGDLTEAQYTKAVATPIKVDITPTAQGCAAATGKAYFCQYVQDIILNDPSFGKNATARYKTLQQGGLQIHTTLDAKLQKKATELERTYVPSHEDYLDVGSVINSVEVGTGRILAMAQNTKFNEDPAYLKKHPDYQTINYSTDENYGGSQGFQTGSTYKIFTLTEWLKQGHSLSEVVDGNARTIAQSNFTNSCGSLDGPPWTLANSSAGEGGYVSVQTATSLSINGAFASMAEELDLCKIKNDAKAMGVHRADGKKLETNPTSVIGTNYIAPLTMATAYAGYANDGKFCSSVAIDSVTDSSGAAVEVPKSTCTQAVSKDVAQAVTYALKGPLASGTATASNPNDGTDHFGKTGTTDAWQQTWMIESSTKVTTAVWVGQTQGSTDLRTQYFNGEWAPQARHNIMINMQRTVDEKYGGGTFDAPESTYTYAETATVPDVSGQSYSAAAATLSAAGFNPVNGGDEDSSVTKGLVSSTSPSSGSSATKGSAVTVHTSNGELVATPSVTGQPYTAATATLAAAGFTNVAQKCVATTDQTQDQIVQSQNPEGGADGNPSKNVTLTTLCFGTTTG